MTQNERLPQLVSHLLDGDPSEAELLDLNGLLRSEANREFLVDHLLLDSLLLEEVGAEPLTALVDLVSDPATATAVASASTGQKTSLRYRSRMPLRGAVAAAILFMAALAVGRWGNTAWASPEKVVRAALDVHQQAIERIYVVDVQRASNRLGEETFRDVRIHTQGDRFYVEMNRNARRWVWGRDPQGNYWLTLGSRRAIQIDADEAGVPLQLIGELYGLEVESMLDSFIKYCRLTHSDDSESLHVITAVPMRRWQRQIQSATIEVDRESKAVRRLTLNRSLPEQGECKVTFTLVDSGIPDESKYSVDGHLKEPFTVYKRDSRADQRRKALSNWNGMAAERWIK
jgi:hypothetical protein